MLSTLLSLLALASVAVASTCSPDFSGREVSIVTKDGSMEWGWGEGQLSGGLRYQNINSGSEFLVVPVLGFPAAFPAYHIWAFNSPNVQGVIQGPRSHPPVLAWSGSEGAVFTINCATCSSVHASEFPGGKFASDCVISWLDSGICVRPLTEGVGDWIRQYPCEGVDDEKFDFVM